ncbi:MAG: hypothetical protein ABL889_00185 [Terricaulis sp.]
MSALAGTNVQRIEAKIDAALSGQPDLSAYAQKLQERRSTVSQLPFTLWDDVTFYGSVVDEMLRVDRNKLRLSLLSHVIPQKHLVHATIVGSWIPASVLESPGPPAGTLVAMADDFFRNLRLALPNLGFEHVGLVGFVELKKCFGENEDGHDVAMATDWYLRRGDAVWAIRSPVWPQYSLHVHLIGFATRFQAFSSAEEIDDAFDRRFPERWSVKVRPWIVKNEVIENIVGLGSYVWKIGPHRKHNPATPMPGPDEICANARFWDAVGHNRRNFDINGHWPERGEHRLPRSFLGSLDRASARKRQLAWELGKRIWTLDDLDMDCSASLNGEVCRND